MTMQAWLDSIAAPPMASVVTIAQVNTANASSVTSMTVSLSGVTVGHALVLAWVCGQSTVFTGFTISTTTGTSSTWTIDDTYTQTRAGVAVAHAVAQSTSLTVTVSWPSGGSQIAQASLFEVAGSISFDKVTNYSLPGTYTVGPVTPAAAGELFIALLGGSTGFTGVNAPFTVIGNTGSRQLGGYYVDPTTAAQSATFTHSGQNTDGCLAAYKAA